MRCLASHSSLARRTISSNTGCGLPGEADITFSTSIVARLVFDPFAVFAVARDSPHSEFRNQRGLTGQRRV